MTDADLTAIERDIETGDLTHSQVHQLVAEIRRQRSVLDQVDESTQRIEAGLERVQAGELAIIEAYFKRVCDRAEATINRTGMVSGSHYAAMQVELDELRKRSARWAA